MSLWHGWQGEAGAAAGYLHDPFLLGSTSVPVLLLTAPPPYPAQ